MIQIQKTDISSKQEINDFVNLPFAIYSDTPQWVPPILNDIKVMLNPQKHPFYEHSEAEFYTAKDGSQTVGRLAVLENKPFNAYHGKRQASFYLFECMDDYSIAEKLFHRGIEWAKKRNLTKIVGPKGFSGFDGYGLLVEGYEHRQMMTMMNYNKPNYPAFLEKLGFKKEVDWVSCYTRISDFKLPEKVKEVARRVEDKGSFKVLNFHSKRELMKWAWKIGQAYNKTFVNNWEYYPLTDREIQFVVDNVLVVALPELIKTITYKDEIVGFLFAFPDISAALQRQKGSLTPWALMDYLRELKKTEWVSFNGVGILPELHGRGGNALLFSEIAKTATRFENFVHGELTQVAESATQMRKDLLNLGVKPYKNHRIYSFDI